MSAPRISNFWLGTRCELRLTRVANLGNSRLDNEELDYDRMGAEGAKLSPGILVRSILASGPDRARLVDTAERRSLGETGEGQSQKLKRVVARGRVAIKRADASDAAGGSRLVLGLD